LPELISIALDAVGGDHAPAEIVRGAVDFVRSELGEGVRVLLVGDAQVIAAELVACDADGDTRLPIVHAPQTITMEEHPMEGIRKKPESSIAICAKLVKSGEAQATLSAGNTGACMLAALLLIERLPGISRPPIASLLPLETGRHCLLVDAGSNIDCQPSHLADFALLGSIYAERAMGIKNPTVALLSNGEEDTKGNELVKKARPLLKEIPINFVGNIESSHLFEGGVDVIVCDGFEGNILLKAAEGMGKLCISHVQRTLAEAQTDGERAVLKSALKKLITAGDYAEYGGAPLLGINGISVIAHGRSNARAIFSGLRVASQAIRSGYVNAVKSALEGMPKE
jgi:phosphate acyltransferase